MMRILRYVYVIYACIIFVLLMLPVFLWSLLVIPFGRIRGGNLIYGACTVWSDCWCFLCGIRHRNIYEYKTDPNTSFIYVANHISYLDSAIIPKVFRRPVRPLGKVEMSKIPVFGFIYRNVIVTVDRSSAENRARSVQLLKSTLKRGISVLVFPEGTFNMTGEPLKSFYDGAFRVAIETATPIQPVLILDTYSRMHYSSVFSLNPGRSRAVFLPPVEVRDLRAEDLPQLRDRVYQQMEAALLRHRAAWIESAQDTVQLGS